MTKSRDPLVPELEQILPDEFAARNKRPGIVDAMHHEGINKAVRTTGCKKLFVAGITTEICVTRSAPGRVPRTPRLSIAGAQLYN
jgi:hypothetical protein